MKATRLLFLVALFFLRFASSLYADDTAYEIKMDMPAKVGQESNITASGTVAMKYVWKDSAGKPASETSEKYSLELRGINKVLTVDETSLQPTKVQITVDMFEKDQKVLLPKGAVIVAENQNGDTKFTVDGKEPDTKVLQVLSAFLEVRSPADHKSYGSVLQPEKPMKIGETWQPDAKALAECESSPRFQIDVGSIDARLKLVDARMGAHGPIFQIESKLKMTGHSDWNEGRIIKSATSTTEATAIFPKDPRDSKTKIHNWTLFTANMSVKAPDGRIADCDYTFDRTIDDTSELTDTK